MEYHLDAVELVSFSRETRCFLVADIYNELWNIREQKFLDALDPLPAKYCIHCGFYLSEYAMFCPHCGGAINSVDWDALDAQKFSGPWRHGTMLIARKNTVFPPRCLKTNLPTSLFVRTKLSWTHPVFWMLILLCLCWPLFLSPCF